jgi:hypothetical protein
MLSLANYGELKGCGEYEISGTIRKDEKDILKILVHEGTKSEYKILISSNELASVAGFINRDVIFNAEIDSIDGTKLHGTGFVEFKNRIPNPLEMKGATGFKLIKNKECVK